MTQKILVILLFLSIILEPTLLAFPAVIIFSILLFFLDGSRRVLILIFIACVFLDILRMQNIGATSLFLFLVFFALDFYRKNFDVSDSRIVLSLAFVFSFMYASFAKYSINIIFFLALFGVLFFSLRKTHKNYLKSHNPFFLRR